MWTVVHVAVGLETAEKISKRLQEEGFLVKINLLTKERDEELYEILAPEFEADEIQEVLFDLGIL
ncbi:MAG: hypothetical protein GXZ06_09000 [Tissierellia bacterium]|nr:hypothetical protein [Tissierellia bacterium]